MTFRDTVCPLIVHRDNSHCFLLYIFSQIIAKYVSLFLVCCCVWNATFVPGNLTHDSRPQVAVYRKTFNWEKKWIKIPASLCAFISENSHFPPLCAKNSSRRDIGEIALRFHAILAIYFFSQVHTYTTENRALS